MIIFFVVFTHFYFFSPSIPSIPYHQSSMHTSHNSPGAMSSKKNSRKLPSWMLGDSTKPITSQKKQKTTTKVTPTKNFTYKGSANPTEDPLDIYKIRTKPSQDPHQRLQEIFKSKQSTNPNKRVKKSPTSPVHSTSTTLLPSPVKYNTPEISPNSTPEKSPKTTPEKKISPKTTPENKSPKSTEISPVKYIISATQINKKNSPSNAKKTNNRPNKKDLSPIETDSPKVMHTLGNSPLRSPKLSPERSSPSHFAKNALLTETELKHVLEHDNQSDNESNYSSRSEAGEHGSDGDDVEGSGSENELNDEENDDFEFFANSDSIFSPLPSPDLSGSEEKSMEQQETKPKRNSGFICDQPCSKKMENNNKQLTDALENIQKLHYLYGEQWYFRFLLIFI